MRKSKKIRKPAVEPDYYERKMMVNPETQKLDKLEKFIAELTWGGIPLDEGKPDVLYIRRSHLFKEKRKEFETSEHLKQLYER